MKRLFLSSFLFMLFVKAIAQPGVIDPSFTVGTGANNTVFTMALQTNGKIFIGGYFNQYNSTSRTRVARVNTDGTLDATFLPGTGANNPVLSSAIQPADGKIIIGGNFTTYNGTARNRIARLNTDGTLDLTFDPGTGVNNSVFDIEIQNDGKIILVGDFTTFNGLTRNHIVRLNTDGSIDNTFQHVTGANSYIWSITRQPSDDKLIIGGNFTLYDGNTAMRVARINTDGTFDNTFNAGTGANDIVTAVTLQANGKVLVGGDLTDFNGTAVSKMVRLNSNGSIDPSFTTAMGAGANDQVSAIAVQSNGKIIISGYFTTVDGASRNRIARLNPNGSLDLNFVPGSGGGSIIRTMAVQSDNNLVIGGYFTNYNGTTINRLTRLINNFPLPVELSQLKGRINDQTNEILWSTSMEQNVNGFEIERSQDGTHFTSIGFVKAHGNSQVENNYQFIDEHISLSSYQYRLKMEDIDGKYTYSDVITLTRQSEQTTISFFPNPVQDQLTIQSTTALKKATLTVYGISGQVMYRATSLQGQQMAVPTQQLSKGTYFAELKQNAETYRFTFVK